MSHFLFSLVIIADIVVATLLFAYLAEDEGFKFTPRWWAGVSGCLLSLSASAVFLALQ